MKLNSEEQEHWLGIVGIRAKLGDTQLDAITYADRVIKAFRRVPGEQWVWLDIVENRATLEGHVKAIAYADKVVESFNERVK